MLGAILAAAGMLLKAALPSVGPALGSSFGSAIGTGLGTGLLELITGAFRQSGQQTLATQLQTNPTPPTLVAAQNVLAQQMTANPTFRQQVETTLRTESPSDWQWAQSTGTTVTDWNGYFAEILAEVRKPRADKFLREHGISNEQYRHDLTGQCPVGGEIALVRYYRPEGQWYYEVSLSSWLWGADPDPYASKLTRGSYAQCDNGHRWQIYA